MKFSNEVLELLYDEVRELHSTPNRFYHNVDHVNEVINEVMNHPDCTPELVIAAAYHDAVYDPTAINAENEVASCYLAGKRASEWGYNDNEVRRLILLTIDHKILDPNDTQGKILIDADLARFSAQPYELFVQNNEDIRREYSHVSDADWDSGREGVLLKYLLRNPFYYIYDESHTNQATLNIVRFLRERVSNAG